MKVPEPAQGFLLRIDDVAERLEHLAPLSPPPIGLTEPDQPSGERWEWGQVWAHLGEFVPYWTGEIKKIVDAGSDEPVSFGRVKTDPVRVGAIERDRRTPPEELIERLQSQLRDARVLLADLGPDDWKRRGAHETLGAMDVEGMVEAFLCRHLEDHADQLENLVRTAPSP